MKSKWIYPGKVHKISYHNNLIKLSSENCDIHLCLLTDDLLQVKMIRPGEKIYDSIAIYQRNWPKIDFTVEESQTHLVIKTQRLQLEILLDPYCLKIWNSDGKLILADYLHEGLGFNSDGSQIRACKTLNRDDKFFGLGERTGFLNKRGEYHELWNHDQSEPHVYSTKHLYKTIPFFIGVQGSLAYGIFFDNSYLSRYDFGEASEEYYYFAADGGGLNYYFCYGPSVYSVIERYTELTGRMELPPLWSLGFHQSKYSYYPDTKVAAIAKQFRQRQIPCDVIHLDIDYMDGYRIFTWDQERFPDPEQMIDALHEAGFKVITIVDPGIKVDYDYPIFTEGLNQEIFCTDSAGVPYIGEVWPGKSMYPDFANSEVREWWAEKNRQFLKSGIDGLWNDMNEPANFATKSATLPLEIVHQNDGRLLTHRQFHNLYGIYMVMGTKRGLLQAEPNKRPFILSRSGFAGIQRYSAVWTGDNRSYWEHLSLSIPMLTTLGLCGVPFAGSDIGGFGSALKPELFARWIQLGSLYPFCRIHSDGIIRNQEPWSFGEEIAEIAREYISLRYQLLPYIYNLFYQAALSGIPVMRPLFLEYQNDSRTTEINDQFMLGDSILVAPVIQPGKDCREVYLPRGEWYDFHTDETYSGGKSILAAAPLERMPIFIKAGSIIPLAPVINYVGERLWNEIKLLVYPDLADVEYMYYEDDGQSFDYRQGKYNLTSMRVKFSEKLIELNIRSEFSGYVSPVKSYQLIFKGQKARKQVSVNGITQEVSVTGTDLVCQISIEELLNYHD